MTAMSATAVITRLAAPAGSRVFAAPRQMAPLLRAAAAGSEGPLFGAPRCIEPVWARSQPRSRHFFPIDAKTHNEMPPACTDSRRAEGPLFGAPRQMRPLRLGVASSRHCPAAPEPPQADIEPAPAARVDPEAVAQTVAATVAVPKRAVLPAHQVPAAPELSPREIRRGATALGGTAAALVDADPASIEAVSAGLGVPACAMRRRIERLAAIHAAARSSAAQRTRCRPDDRR